MRRSLLLKTLITGVLAVGLVVPLSAIVGMVRARHAASRSVLEDVQRAGVGAQTLTGPLLVVPFRRSVSSEVTDRETGKKTLVTTHDEGRLYFLPDVLDADVRVGTETRYRGIYSALLYNATHEIRGSFGVPERFGVAESPDTRYEFEDATLILGISDTRGIGGTPALEWDGDAIEWQSGTGEVQLPDGVHAAIGRVTPGTTFTFELELLLQGTETLEYVPAGKQTAIEMRSEWPHPSFQGRFLPETRTITAQGFEARWRTTHLSSSVEPALRACLGGKGTCELGTLGVSFIEPVNVYLQTERAAKYGFLFVAITFLVFLLFELLKQLAIHPVQYGLVGVALALFFLLLLALTEHVPFAAAYAVASASCIGLLAFYVSFVLRSVRRAAGFTTLLTALYGALFVLLRSEDMALLLGAILLFGILATVMVVTRRVDWYRIALDRSAAGAAEAEG